MAALIWIARTHVKNFWDGKAKVPFVDGYNEAISRTGEMVKVMGLLVGTWGVSAVLAVVWGY